MVTKTSQKKNSVIVKCSPREKVLSHVSSFHYRHWYHPRSQLSFFFFQYHIMIFNCKDSIEYYDYLDIIRYHILNSKWPDTARNKIMINQFGLPDALFHNFPQESLATKVLTQYSSRSVKKFYVVVGFQSTACECTKQTSSQRRTPLYTENSADFLRRLTRVLEKFPVYAAVNDVTILRLLENSNLWRITMTTK